MPLTAEDYLDRYQTFMYRIAHKLSSNNDYAEDLVQKARIKVYQSFVTFDNKLSFKPWVATIIKNTHKDAIKKRSDAINRNYVSLSQIACDNNETDSESEFTIEVHADPYGIPKLVGVDFSHRRENLLLNLEESLSILNKDFEEEMNLLQNYYEEYRDPARTGGRFLGKERSRAMRAKMRIGRKYKLNPDFTLEVLEKEVR